ncbi:hypothetical protein GGR56DRAFT_671085 [Xylariaceae sp. FL0804]|nr:hypothetical protein GGR56DRAFT_671085 [Xylariaceae sp. FL0804]
MDLDWKAVNEWMRPKAYNKRSAVKGMSRRIERGIREKNEMYKIFFIDGKAPDKSTDTIDVENYVKDHVSKDLGVPWHQISTKHLRDWEQKGYPKQDFHQWWRQPNDEEKKRMLNMMTGASLRKKL